MTKKYGIAAALALVAMFGQNTTEQRDISPHEEQFVQANGVKLHYLDWGGCGAPLVFLTGYGDKEDEVVREMEKFYTSITARN